jgi:hypothetical protein
MQHYDELDHPEEVEVDQVDQEAQEGQEVVLWQDMDLSNQ